MKNLSNIKIVSLDFGGTLAKELEDESYAFHEIFNELGFKVNLNEVKRVYADSWKWWLKIKSETGKIWNENALADLTRRMLRELNLPFNDEIINEVLRMYPYKLKFKLYDDVKPTLDKLKDMGYPLIIISNVSSTKNLSIYLERLGIKHYFKYLIGSGTIGFEKPDPRIFHYAVKLVKVKPDEIIHIGDDYEADYLGALNAGLKAILIDRNNRHGNKNCMRIITLTQIINLIAK